MTNDTEKPVNADNMPKLVSATDDGPTFKADLSQDKLLTDETCDIAYTGELDLKHDEVSALSFAGKIATTGLEDAEQELNDEIAKVIDGYADEDAQKEAQKKEEEEAAAKEEEKRSQDKKALEKCKGKTALEAKKVAKGTDYAARFEDSYGVDVTDGVKKDSEAGAAKVTSVKVKDAGFLTDASVTFELDYVDPDAQKERDEKEAAEQAEKEAAAQREAEEKARAEAEAALPAEYKSALRKAESYSRTMHMSKRGIYEQLVSEYGENFSADAAQYAIDNMEADWNANALAKAKSYSDTMHMSKAGIYDQLVSEFGEQFEPDQAQYAVDNVEADWNANALAKARSYQDTMAMSPEAIRDQLVSEYGERFTQEEADYAIANL